MSEEVNPALMNIVSLRQYAKTKGITVGLSRMKKIDIINKLKELDQGDLDEKKEEVSRKESAEEHEELPVKKKSTNKKAALTQEVVEEVIKSSTPGINMRVLRAAINKKVKSCENPQLLLNILSAFD